MLTPGPASFADLLRADPELLAEYITELEEDAWHRDWEGEAAAAGAEIVRRIRLKAAHDGEPRKQAIAWKACKYDAALWINDWVWTFDPRAHSPLPKTLPFRLWPKQVELLLWLWTLYQASRGGAIKKSRDMGVTWLIAAFAVWLWLFWAQTTIGFGSRKLELVDKKGDPKCIFWKVRFIIRHLPSWMRPVGYGEDGPHDNYARIVNPENSSVITGEGGTNIGRGDRTSIYFLDEYAKIPYATQVWESVQDTSDVVVPLSTSGGMGTHFWELEQQRRLPFYHLHYSHDPRKDEDWAAAKRKALGAAGFAREHEMDDAAALDYQIIEGAWARSCVELHKRLSKLDPEGRDTGGLDVGDSGEDETVLARRKGPLVRGIWVWDDGASVERSMEIGRRAKGCETLYFDRVGVGANVASTSEIVNLVGAVVGLANGERAPTHWRFDDDPSLAADQRFKDLATALWWNLRIRAQKTHEFITGVRDHSLGELLALPEDVTLIAQLCGRKYVDLGDKIGLESKKEMARRGVGSPDRAEAVAYAFCPPLRKKPFNAPPKRMLR